MKRLTFAFTLALLFSVAPVCGQSGGGESGGGGGGGTQDEWKASAGSQADAVDLTANPLNPMQTASDSASASVATGTALNVDADALNTATWSATWPFSGSGTVSTRGYGRIKVLPHAEAGDDTWTLIECFQFASVQQTGDQLPNPYLAGDGTSLVTGRTKTVPGGPSGHLHMVSITIPANAVTAPIKTSMLGSFALWADGNVVYTGQVFLGPVGADCIVTYPDGTKRTHPLQPGINDFDINDSQDMAITYPPNTRIDFESAVNLAVLPSIDPVPHTVFKMEHWLYLIQD